MLFADSAAAQRTPDDNFRCSIFADPDWFKPIVKPDEDDICAALSGNPATKMGTHFYAPTSLQLADEAALLKSIRNDISDSITVAEQTLAPGFELPRNIYIYFSSITSKEAANSAVTRNTGEKTSDCYIVLFASAAVRPHGRGVSPLRTTVTHEYNHCIMVINAHLQTHAIGSRWWQEGMADAFANQVSPDAGIALAAGETFKSVSRHTDMISQTYSNEPFVAWLVKYASFLHNDDPDKRMLNFVVLMPTSPVISSQTDAEDGGDERNEQRYHLSQLLTREDLSNFVRDFADGHLTSWAGLSYGGPPKPEPGPTVTVGVDGAVLSLPMPSFRLVHQRITVTIPTGRRGTVSLITPGPATDPLLVWRAEGEAGWRSTALGEAGMELGCGESRNIIVAGMSGLVQPRKVSLGFRLMSGERCEPAPDAGSGTGAQPRDPANSHSDTPSPEPKTGSGSGGTNSGGTKTGGSSDGGRTDADAPPSGKPPKTGKKPPSPDQSDEEEGTEYWSEKNLPPSGGGAGRSAEDGGQAGGEGKSQQDGSSGGNGTSGSQGSGGASGDGSGGSRGAGGRSQRSGGHGAGDPHYVTGDGRMYSNQLAGEFWGLVGAQDMAIQIRQEPWQGSRSVSSISAVALRIGSARVSFSAGPTGGLVVNGATVKADRPFRQIDFGGGGQLQVSATQGEIGTVVAIWTDGSSIKLVANGWWIDFDLQLAADRSSSSHLGLLGSADGNERNDLLGSTGKAADDSNPAAVDAFVNSWRVRADESLFAYPPGRTSASYQNRAFPTQVAAPAPAALARGRDSCATGGVSDAATLGSCAFDLAVTGETKLVGSHRDRQRQLRKFRGIFDSELAPTIGTATPVARDIMIDLLLQAREIRTFIVDLKARVPLVAYPKDQTCLDKYDGDAAGWQWFDVRGRALSPAKKTCSDLVSDDVEPGRYYLVIGGSKSSGNVSFQTHISD